MTRTVVTTDKLNDLAVAVAKLSDGFPPHITESGIRQTMSAAPDEVGFWTKEI